MRDYYAELHSLKYGPLNSETVKACEQIIKEAQHLNDTELEYAAKTAYLKAVTFNDEPEKMLAVFPWLLNERDKHPEKYNYRELLWSYKWVVSHMTLFSSISKERILSILQDMETRYISAGYGTKTITSYKQVIYQDLGELELAEKYYNEWLLMKDGEDLSDCTACIIDQEVAYFLVRQEFEKAIEKAQDLLSFKYSCETVPDVTYSKVMLAYLHLGELEKGVEFCKKAMETFNIEESELEEYGAILTFLGVTKNFVKAKRIFIHQLPFAFESKCPYYAYEFYLGAAVFLKSLLKENKFEISLPKTLCLKLNNQDDIYQTQDVYDLINNNLTKITKEFDERNGNNFYSQQNENQIALLNYSQKIEFE